MKKNSRLSSEPSFEQTVLESPITEFALPMLAFKGETFWGSGTAIIIGKYLAITARHVIADYYQQFEGEEPSKLSTRESEASFHLILFQRLNSCETPVIWNVTRLWACNFTDIAVLRLSPTTPKAQDYRWRLPTLSLIPPKLGERVTAFGYRLPNVIPKGDDIEWRVDPRTSVGQVREIHSEKRDSCRLPWPCFRTNARFDESMSGGPVFDNRGQLCGLVCSTFPPSKETQEHASYVITLWPLMGLKIDFDRKGCHKGIKYPMLELARDGIIHAAGWERIILNKDEKGNIINVSVNGDAP